MFHSQKLDTDNSLTALVKINLDAVSETRAQNSPVNCMVD